MANKKEKLFDKLVKKDLNNDLEEVLAKKNFNEEVKNLLLDILYKIDDSYNDYEIVKKNVLSKEEYMENYIKSIKENCEYIEFVRPDGSQKKLFVVDKENKKIVCFPMAIKLLYAISKIQKCDNILKQDSEILNKALTNTINIGNNINTVEPLRDFTGYGWSIATADIENFYYNLIYQDLIILIGNNLLEEWANKNDSMVDYMELFKDQIEKKYGKKLSKDIIEQLSIIAILLQLNIDEKFKNDFINLKENSEEEYIKMQNKEKYLDDLSKTKKELAKDIKNIDILLNDKEKLTKEYNKRNKKLPLEEKIFSKRVLAIKLIEEREDFILKLQELTNKMNARFFLQKQKALKENVKYLELINTENTKKQVLEKIILFQKRVLQAIKIKIEEAKTREEITNIIYEIRYLNLIPIKDNKNVGKIAKLQKCLLETESLAISKSYELKNFKEICKDPNLNMNILKYIFSLDIIKLEDIFLKILDENDGVFVQFYDDDIADEKFKIDFDLKKEDLKIRFNKKIRLFDL